MKYKLIIFDLDGTLVDAYQAVALSLNYVFKKMDLPTVDHETIKRNVGWGDKNLLSRFVQRNKVKKALAIYRKHHRRALRHGVKFLPYARQSIFDLKRRGFKLAIASNRPSFYTKIILKHLKVLPIFDCVLCADQVARGKPAPDLLFGILKKLKLTASETLYVGDMTLDARAGQRAHMKTVIVLTGSSKRSEILPLRPYKILKNIKSLRSILV